MEDIKFDPNPTHELVNLSDPKGKYFKQVSIPRSNPEVICDEGKTYLKRGRWDYIETNPFCTTHPPTGEVMSLKEFREKVAIDNDYDSFEDMSFWYMKNHSRHDLTNLIIDVCDSASELYASQFKARAEAAEQRVKELEYLLQRWLNMADNRELPFQGHVLSNDTEKALESTKP